MSLKTRSLWPDCRTPGTHDLCLGSVGNAECICWHHVAQARSIRHVPLLLAEIERELAAIEGSTR